MPFKSEAQRRYMYARHPEIAKRWSREYPNQKNLPKKAKKKKWLSSSDGKTRTQ